MANTTTIKSIANNAYNVVSVKDGEDTSKVFSIDSGGSWNGDMVVPWVGSQVEMYKALIFYGVPGYDALYVFQDYWYPSNKDQIKYCADGKYVSGLAVDGDSTGGGNKILTFGANGSMSMSG